MPTRHRLKLSILFGISLAGLGCGGSAASTEGEPVYTSTAVTINADGTETVTTVPITLSEERLQNEQRERAASADVTAVGSVVQALTNDPRCSPLDLWIFDQTNWTGNRICFSAAGSAGTANLERYCRISGGSTCTSTWSGAVRSYSSPAFGGQFAKGSCTTNCAAYRAGTSKAVASTCEQGASTVSSPPVCFGGR